MPRPLGIHLRLHSSLMMVLERAIDLCVPVFQMFLIDERYRKHIMPSREEIALFRYGMQRHRKQVYLHASYYINLGRSIGHGRRIFERELELAMQLGITEIILHPGSIHPGCTITHGVHCFARALNDILRNYPMMTVVLENTAHRNCMIGSSMEACEEILNTIVYQDRVGFCIDTSHAHAYGYPLIEKEDQEAFVELLDAKIGISRIMVLHINDTKESCGSCIDRHAILGEGIIGIESLQRFVMHPKLLAKPIIIEPPRCTELQERRMLHMVQQWV